MRAAVFFQCFPAVVVTSLTLLSFAFIASSIAGDASAQVNGSSNNGGDDIILAGRINSMLMPIPNSTVMNGTISAPPEMPDVTTQTQMNDSTSERAMQFSMAQDVTWLLSGDWVMTVDPASDAITFDAEFIKVTTDATMLHTHRVTNFISTADNASGNFASSFDEATNTAKVSGTSDVYFNDALAWQDVNTTVSVTNGTVLKVAFDKEDVDNHFHGQPIYGLVDTFSRNGFTLTIPSPSSVQERLGTELSELQANATQAQSVLTNQTGQATSTFTEEARDVLGNITGSIRNLFGGT